VVVSRYTEIECPAALEKLAAIAVERSEVEDQLAAARRRLAEVRGKLSALASVRSVAKD